MVIKTLGGEMNAKRKSFFEMKVCQNYPNKSNHAKQFHIIFHQKTIILQKTREEKNESDKN